MKPKKTTAVHPDDFVLCTRAQAKSFGMVRYFTGTKCKNGHLSPRLASNGVCLECLSISNKKWKENNPQKTEAIRKAFKEKNIQEIRRLARDRQRVYRLKHPDKIKAQKKSFSDRHSVRLKEQQRLKRGLPLPTRPCPEMCEACERRKPTSLDHCHTTGSFRGWLCAQCNSALGFAGDNEDGLMKLIAYLKKAAAEAGSVQDSAQESVA